MDTRRLLTALSGHRRQAGLAGVSSWRRVCWVRGEASFLPGQGQKDGNQGARRGLGAGRAGILGQAGLGRQQEVLVQQAWKSPSRSHFLACPLEDAHTDGMTQLRACPGSSYDLPLPSLVARHLGPRPHRMVPSEPLCAPSPWRTVSGLGFAE